VRIGLDAAAGLGAAHALCDDHGAPLGLVHRDVSPQNVLVGADGVARIVDFGIAKCRDVGASARTTTGALKGKVAYMSPEYVRGRGIDARSDVFGLGVVLWEAFTGARLFRADTELETMTRVTSAPAPLVSTLAPDLAPLDAVLARALEKSPARRFSGMQELASTLVEAAAAAGLVGAAAEVTAEVQALAGEALEQRRVLVRARMQAATTGVPAPPESMRLVPGAVESSSGQIVDPSEVAPTVQRFAPGSAGTPAGEPPRTDAFVLRAREQRPRSHRVVWVALGAATVAAGVAAFLSLGRTPPDAPASAETASGAVVRAPPSTHDDPSSKASEPPAVPPTAAAAADPSASVPTAAASATNAPARPVSRPQTRGPRPRPGSKDTPDPNPYSP
jgi:serine/threonine-protein kinase